MGLGSGLMGGLTAFGAVLGLVLGTCPPKREKLSPLMTTKRLVNLPPPTLSSLALTLRYPEPCQTRPPSPLAPTVLPRVRPTQPATERGARSPLRHVECAESC
jgi:hypothetical protein